jgi:predicted ATPase
LAIADRTGERAFEAELLRLQACVLLADGGADAASHAQAVLERGLEVARAQQERSFELRLACDLARLWADRGDRGRAAALLGRVCQWFTEGLGSTDFAKAKALLDDL